MAAEPILKDNDDYPALCDNCQEVDQNTHHFEHEEQNWCIDCMRSAHLCLGCNTYLPDEVEDYYEYEEDMCPDCINEEN